MQQEDLHTYVKKVLSLYKIYEQQKVINILEEQGVNDKVTLINNWTIEILILLGISEDQAKLLLPEVKIQIKNQTFGKIQESLQSVLDVIFKGNKNEQYNVALELCSNLSQFYSWNNDKVIQLLKIFENTYDQNNIEKLIQTLTTIFTNQIQLSDDLMTVCLLALEKPYQDDWAQDFLNHYFSLRNSQEETQSLINSDIIMNQNSQSQEIQEPIFSKKVNTSEVKVNLDGQFQQLKFNKWPDENQLDMQELLRQFSNHKQKLEFIEYVKLREFKLDDIIDICNNPSNRSDQWLSLLKELYEEVQNSDVPNQFLKDIEMNDTGLKKNQQKINSHGKSLDEIFSELMNTYQQNAFENKHLVDIEKLLLQIQEQYDSIHHLLLQLEEDSEYNNQKIRQTILKWKTTIQKEDSKFKLDSQDSFLVEEIQRNVQLEIIAYLLLGAKLVYGYPLRDVQLLSVLVILNAKENGRLLQVKTGEGKSLIVAVLAAYKVIQGFKVDIVTSSDVLARRDAQQGGKLFTFYKLFGISCADNSLKTDESNDFEPQLKSKYNSRNNQKRCYLKDIIYGTTGNFEGDVLKDGYSGYGTLLGRNPEFVIVDEVDNMLIDNQSFSTMLSRPTPGMHTILFVLKTIWQRVNLEARVLDSDCIGVIVDRGNNEQGIQIDSKDGFANFISDLVLGNIEAQISKERNSLHLSDYLIKYIKKTIKTWSTSAITAKFDLHKGVNYIVKQNEIKIIDIGTGSIQERMEWQNGVHQFLQMKEEVEITPEKLTTNFMSNITFFKRYKNNICGLTGTLGSVSSQNALANTYGLDFCFIPQFKQNKLVRLPAIINESFDQWLQSIVQTCLTEANKGRAVLVICETINDAGIVYETLIENYIESFVTLYTDDSKTIEDQEIDSGYIIIATNLAGRGTDIKTTKSVEKANGLHVIVAFLPVNVRIQDQAFGRTARQGNNGTCQLILCLDSENIQRGLSDEDRWIQEYNKQANRIPGLQKQQLLQLNEDQIIKQRDYQESKWMIRQEESAKFIMLKDELFKEYCMCLSAEVRKNEYMFKDIEDRFAMWLKANADKNQEEIEMDFYQFKQELEVEIKQKGTYVPQNPNYENLAASQSISDGNFNQGRDHSNHCLKQDSQNLVAAYNLALCDAVSGNPNKEKSIDQAIHVCELIVDNVKQELSQKMFFNQVMKNEKIENFSEVLAREKIQNQNNHPMQQADNQARGVQQQMQQVEVEMPQQFARRDQAQNIDLQFDQNLEVMQMQEEINLVSDIHQQLLNIKANINNPEIEIVAEPLYDDGFGTKNYKDQKLEDLIASGLKMKMKMQVKKKKSKWWEVALMFVIGVAQVIVGGIITAFSAGAGAKIGTALMISGVKDIMKAVDCVVNGTPIDWKQWGLEKITTLGSTLLLSGFDALKDAKNAFSIGASKGYNFVSHMIENGLSDQAKQAFLFEAQKHLALSVYQNNCKQIGQNLVQSNALSTAQYVHDLQDTNRNDKVSSNLDKITGSYVKILTQQMRNFPNIMHLLSICKEKVIKDLSTVVANKLFKNEGHQIVDQIKQELSQFKKPEEKVRNLTENSEKLLQSKVLMTCPVFLEEMNSEIQRKFLTQETQNNLRKKFLFKTLDKLGNETHKGVNSSEQSLTTVKDQLNQRQADIQQKKQQLEQLGQHLKSQPNLTQDQIDAYYAQEQVYNNLVTTYNQEQEQNSQRVQEHNANVQKMKQETEMYNSLVEQANAGRDVVNAKDPNNKVQKFLEQLNNQGKIVFFGTIFLSDKNVAVQEIEQAINSNMLIGLDQQYKNAVKQVLLENLNEYYTNTVNKINDFAKIMGNEVEEIFIAQVFVQSGQGVTGSFQEVFKEQLQQAVGQNQVSKGKQSKEEEKESDPKKKPK